MLAIFPRRRARQFLQSQEVCNTQTDPSVTELPSGIFMGIAIMPVTIAHKSPREVRLSFPFPTSPIAIVDSVIAITVVGLC